MAASYGCGKLEWRIPEAVKHSNAACILFQPPTRFGGGGSTDSGSTFQTGVNQNKLGQGGWGLLSPHCARAQKPLPFACCALTVLWKPKMCQIFCKKKFTPWFPCHP